MLISATHKSSGKTVVSVGLCAAFIERGTCVQAFKKGPDYIDSAWLSLASARPCYNLDFNTQSDTEIKSLFVNKSTCKTSLIEANKGLHDGLDPGGKDSNAALAKLLNCSVVLVIDCAGMTRGIAPLLQGYKQFDSKVQIAGAILNQVGGTRHRTKLITAVENYTDIPVLGAVEHHPDMILPERHLGLIPSSEFDAASTAINRIRKMVAEQVDVNTIIKLAAVQPVTPKPITKPPTEMRIGVFRDSAFSFYYPDDLESLEQHGAELIFIDSVNDNALPPVDALFIGGGFPETQAHLLEKNAPLRLAVREAIENKMPVYAECGGLMYLTRSIILKDKQYKMCGVIDADSIMHERPQGRGYVEFTETSTMLWPDVEPKQSYRAHEFHYSSLVNMSQTPVTALEMSRGTGIEKQRDGIVYNNLLATYLHRRDCSQDQWIGRFTRFIKEHKQ